MKPSDTETPREPSPLPTSLAGNASVTIAAPQEMVRLGDYGTFDTRFEALQSEQWRTVKGKAFDDRAGCAAAAALAEDEYEVDLYLSFSAQEEVGLRGARVAAYRVELLPLCAPANPSRLKPLSFIILAAGIQLRRLAP